MKGEGGLSLFLSTLILSPSFILLLLLMKEVLDAPITVLPGVRPKQIQLLARELHVHTIGELLAHYPLRYVDRAVIHPISQLRKEGEMYQFVGEVTQIAYKGEGSKKRLEVTFQDESGRIAGVFFKGISYIHRQLRIGTKYLLFGRVSVFGRTINIVHPEINLYDPHQKNRIPLEPIYKTSESMKKGGLNSRGVLTIISKALQWAAPHLQEYLPAPLLQRYNFAPFAWARHTIHFPGSLEELRRARSRVKFDELFCIQVQLMQQNQQYRTVYQGHRCDVVGSLVNRFYREELPFDLTGAQKRVVREMREDMRTGAQMNRLLQGDVGSGKTVVAVFTMLLAADNGLQSCLMAPTEILAQQHYAGIQRMLQNLPVRIALLTGSTGLKARREITSASEDGSLDILVGTHALIEDNVQFKKLGMVIIDEQHRFGVDQRAKLWRKGKDTAPHVLVMSATPIPRTLALTLYGDLDVSIIDELPPGRKPIKTVHLYETQREKMHELMLQEIEAGHQVYVVFPLIEESEKSDLQSLSEGYARLQEEFPQYEIEIVHGKMSPEEKNHAMARFSTNEAQILVSTTVIEVGVDVPNASVMIIENAERFGLSQLHQLRGRVGRGAEHSYCYLVTGYKLSEKTRARLGTMVLTNNGFEIAEADLQQRGAGSLGGTRQSGSNMQLQLASLAEDGPIVAFARDRARELFENDPSLEKEENASLAEYVAYIGRGGSYNKIG